MKSTSAPLCHLQAFTLHMPYEHFIISGKEEAKYNQEEKYILQYISCLMTNSSI